MFCKLQHGMIRQSNIIEQHQKQTLSDNLVDYPLLFQLLAVRIMMLDYPMKG